MRGRMEEEQGDGRSRGSREQVERRKSKGREDEGSRRTAHTTSFPFILIPPTQPRAREFKGESQISQIPLNFYFAKPERASYIPHVAREVSTTLHSALTHPHTPPLLLGLFPYLTNLQIRSCESTESPSLTLKLSTLPEWGAEMTISIFIALKMAIGSPLFTSPPF